MPTTSTLALQQGEMEWMKYHGGDLYNFGNAIIEQDDGGFVLIGTTKSGGAGAFDAYLIETDASGNIQWEQTYGGSNYDAAYDAIETSDGGIVFVGYTQSYGAGKQDFWMVKLKKEEVRWKVQWMHTYGGKYNDVANAVIEKEDGGFVVAGKTKSTENGSWDYLAVETDSTGEIQWMQTYNLTWGDDNNDDVCTSLIQVTNGYALAGYTYYPIYDKYDIVLITANIIWKFPTIYKYDLGWSQKAYSILKTEEAGYFLAGEIQRDYTDHTDALLMKLEGFSKALDWYQWYGGVNDEAATSLIPTSDGGFALAATSDSYGPGYQDFWLIKTDSSGNEQWTRGYGLGNYDERATSVIETQDHSFALTGNAKHHDLSIYKILVVKTEPEPLLTSTTASGTTFIPMTTVHTATIFTPATSLTQAPVTLTIKPETTIPSFTAMTPGEVATTTGPQPDATVTFEPSPGMTLTVTIPPASTTVTTSATIFTITPKKTPTTTPVTTSEPTSPAPATVTVTDTETETETEPGPPVPGFMTLPALLGLVVVVLFTRRRRNAK